MGAFFCYNGVLQDANDAWSWDEVRQIRDTLLQLTDEYMITDRFATFTEEQQQELIEYRQTLRDLPENFPDLTTIEFPYDLKWLE